MRKIKLDRLTIVADPSLSMPDNSLQMEQGKKRLTIQAQTVAIEEAERLGGFRIFHPFWLPSTTTKLVQSTSFVLPAPGSNLIYRVLSTQQVYRDEKSMFIILEQERVDDGVAEVNLPYDAREAKTSKHIVVFASAPIMHGAKPTGKKVTFCLWEQDNFLMTIIAHGISDQEITRITESVN